MKQFFRKLYKALVNYSSTLLMVVFFILDIILPIIAIFT